MLTWIEMLMPLLMIVLISLPLIPVFQGKKTVKTAKRRMLSHICFFFAIVLGSCFYCAMRAYAAGEDEIALKMAGSIGQGMGFLAAALATGLSALGAGIAVAAAAPAAIGAFSENDKNFGKSMIFVALGEGVAIYGLLISIFIIFMKL
ncbi:MAG: ATP synthase subunit C [Longicatena sp.]|nr:ATP synthase subunit C [Longicatena sp.]